MVATKGFRRGLTAGVWSRVSVPEPTASQLPSGRLPVGCPISVLRPAARAGLPATFPAAVAALVVLATDIVAFAALIERHAAAVPVRFLAVAGGHVQILRRCDSPKGVSAPASEDSTRMWPLCNGTQPGHSAVCARASRVERRTARRRAEGCRSGGRGGGGGSSSPGRSRGDWRQGQSARPAVH